MKSQRFSSDRISTLPEAVIENILCLIPIKEAARTSILSRDWRYTWTSIPKLVFNEKDMIAESTVENEHLCPIDQALRNDMTQSRKIFYAIHQVLLLSQSPIVEFTLSMTADLSCIEIDQILRHLLRKNTVKKLHLNCSYDLPLCIFSFHQLTNLNLHDCSIERAPTFNAFGSLINLCLDCVWITKKALMNILYNSPLLRSFTMRGGHGQILIDDGSTIIELFKCLPAIEELMFSVEIFEWFCYGEVPQKLPTLLVHLRCVYLEGICFCYKSSLDFLALVIRSSPNLEKLKIQIDCEDYISHYYLYRDPDSITMQDYSDIWLGHLVEFEIGNHISNLKTDLGLLKLILAKSPVLSKVSIMVSDKFTKDEESKMLSHLLGTPPKSPLVEITFERHLHKYLHCKCNWL